MNLSSTEPIVNSTTVCPNFALLPRHFNVRDQFYSVTIQPVKLSHFFLVLKSPYVACARNVVEVLFQGTSR